MAQIHNLESKTRYGSRYVAGFIILISSILLAGWVGFFVFLPIKSSMEVVTNLEEKFLPRAEGMVLNFVSLSEPSTITSQVAKQSFVGDEISVRRKVAEAVVAAELERRYTKDQILHNLLKLH